MMRLLEKVLTKDDDDDYFLLRALLGDGLCLRNRNIANSILAAETFGDVNIL